MKIVITGGAGYIGSHTVRQLLKKNSDIIILDNLSRGHKESIPVGVKFAKINLLKIDELKNFFAENIIDAIIHFAAFAYVGESVEDPGLYYRNNVVGSFNLIEAAVESGVKNIIFSSTCSIYGNPIRVPISEQESAKPLNPYAKTKLMIEDILADFETATELKYIALRYFNAAGASNTDPIGESHFPEPHLIPLVLQTALGQREHISIYGDNYPTPDGTCIRDYIHVDDLADAHILALDYLLREKKSEIINLGTGVGNSVKEIIKTAEKITNLKIKSIVTTRRAGDPAILVADNKKAKQLLGWQPKYNIANILQTAFDWHRNPKY